MKLKKVETGHGLTAKIKLGAASVVLRQRPADILRVLLYRPELFGKPYSEWSQELLRSASEWTVGERELMAAMVSHTNACQFCLSAHSTMAGRVLGEDVVQAALADWRTAPVSEPLRQTLGMLVKLTEDPSSVGPEDMRAMRDAGVSDDGIATAIHICAHFCIINRVADALGFRVPSAAAMGRMGAALLRHGYNV